MPRGTTQVVTRGASNHCMQRWQVRGTRWQVRGTMWQLRQYDVLFRWRLDQSEHDTWHWRVSVRANLLWHLCCATSNHALFSSSSVLSTTPLKASNYWLVLSLLAHLYLLLYCCLFLLLLLCCLALSSWLCCFSLLGYSTVWLCSELLYAATSALRVLAHLGYFCSALISLFSSTARLDLWSSAELLANLYANSQSSYFSPWLCTLFMSSCSTVCLLVSNYSSRDFAFLSMLDTSILYFPGVKREEEKRIAKEKEAAELEAKRKSQECLNIEEKSIPQASIRSRKSRIDPTLRNFTVSTKRIPLSDFIPPVTPNLKTVNSLKIGDKHLDTQKGSLESSVKDPIPIPSESDVISNGDYDDDYQKRFDLKVQQLWMPSIYDENNEIRECYLI
ncbi:hypothetical protein Tco_1198967, partial [Tanacetum coccineum]